MTKMQLVINTISSIIEKIEEQKGVKKNKRLSDYDQGYVDACRALIEDINLVGASDELCLEIDHEKILKKLLKGEKSNGKRKF